MPAPRRIGPAANLLGEGPRRNEDEQAIYWVDIEQPRVLRYALASQQCEQFAMPERIGCIAFRKHGGLIAGLQSGFALLDLAAGANTPPTITPLLDLEADQPDNRINDGKCDSRGRFWVGTMHVPQQRAAGVLYRLHGDGSVDAMDHGYGI